MEMITDFIISMALFTSSIVMVKGGESLKLLGWDKNQKVITP